MSLAVGDLAPTFAVETTEGTRTLEGLLRDGPLVLLFYTEDATPMCTAQVCGFRDEFATLRDLGANVLAISADDLDSHRRFAAREALPFPLAADPGLDVARAYDVLADDGKRARRAAFVIGTDGRILAANGHYQPQDMTQFAQVFEALGVTGEGLAG